jgi:hypothetical protein
MNTDTERYENSFETMCTKFDCELLRSELAQRIFDSLK